MSSLYLAIVLFFFTHTATPEFYTLSLHDALPIFLSSRCNHAVAGAAGAVGDRFHARVLRRARASSRRGHRALRAAARSEEHTSELQSHSDLVCRLLLEKKKHKKKNR